jgi:hypothetical protein
MSWSDQKVHIVILDPDQYDQFERDYEGQYRMFDAGELESITVEDLVDDILSDKDS